MRIKYKDETLELIDEIVEVGYKSEKVKVCSNSGETTTIGGFKPSKTVVLIITLPNIENIETQIQKLDSFLANIVVDIDCYLVFANDTKIDFIPKKVNFMYDKYKEFGTMYGTLIVSGSLEKELCKSVFIIGKDGAIYYENTLPNLEDDFDFEKLSIELNRAFSSYTGQGCH
jgi:peroxiredoxin